MACVAQALLITCFAKKDVIQDASLYRPTRPFTSVVVRLPLEEKYQSMNDVMLSKVLRLQAPQLLNLITPIHRFENTPMMLLFSSYLYDAAVITWMNNSIARFNYCNTR